MKHHIPAMRKHAQYFITNAPWTLVATLATGLATYVIMLMLMRFEGLDAVGQFRLLMSIVAMLSLSTLIDTGKILIKYLVQGVMGIVKPLLINRMRWSLLGVAAGLSTAAVFHRQGSDLAPAIAAAALLLPLTFPMNLYAQVYQSRRQFRFNAIINIVKQAVLVLTALIWLQLNWNPIGLFIAYYVVLTAFNTLYMSWQRSDLVSPASSTNQYVRESTILSGSGLFQVILEHIDKFLISYFLGLEALGIYAIGISTGKILLNFVRPFLVIYLPDLVEKQFTLRIQIWSLLVLSVIGCCTAYLLWHLMGLFFKADEFAAYPIAAVVVAGLGIYFVGVTNYYSAVYHKDAQLKVPIITNLITTPIVVTYLLLSLLFGGSFALVLCAGSYPLRELINSVVIALLRSWITDPAIASA